MTPLNLVVCLKSNKKEQIIQINSSEPKAEPYRSNNILNTNFNTFENYRTWKGCQ